MTSWKEEMKIRPELTRSGLKIFLYEFRFALFTGLRSDCIDEFRIDQAIDVIT